MPSSIRNRCQRIFIAPAVKNATTRSPARNREITMTTEVRALDTGDAAEVTALYLGVGQGYYATGDGCDCGCGGYDPDCDTQVDVFGCSPGVACVPPGVCEGSGAGGAVLAGDSIW